MPVVDFRSDLVGRATDPMILAMAEALRRPGAFEFREDACERELETTVARLLGKQDALLFPTCTMANEAAIALACHPGDSVFVEQTSHIVTSEGGAPAAIAGAMMRPIAGESGRMDLDVLKEALAPAGSLASKPALVVIENTHNRSAGTALPPGYLSEVHAVASNAGVPIHLDGARVFNAAVALGLPVSDLTDQAHTVAISLNKGLCAPLGAMLAGPKAVIQEAERVRQRLGGGMRPTGFIAAAALEAIRTMVPRLAEDHRLAGRAALSLQRIAGLKVVVPKPITNLVVIEPPGMSPSDFVRELKSEGVLALPFGPHAIRFAFHRDIDEPATDRLVAAVEAVAGRLMSCTAAAPAKKTSIAGTRVQINHKSR